ncbi:MAG: DNA primase [Aquiluna sp.]|jgi:DNA primase
MPRVKQSDIEQLKDRVDIVELIGSYISLKAAGPGSFKGLCPFHGEKSPSFHVRSNPAFYHCFGCGVGGDAFKFVQEIDKVGFSEAIEKLAQRTGYQLTYEEGERETSNRNLLLNINKAASDYYKSQLQSEEGKAARDFLVARGFDLDSISEFEVGYAPKGWQNLSQHLTEKGFTLEDQALAGLLSKGEKGFYDRFRGRVLWPIRDANSQVVGFGARKLYVEDQGPKYLNTPETPVYHKSTVLYGLDLARREIASKRQVIVVEGYTDVMACHLAGEKTAVATCGTAFGEEHIKLINRLLGQSTDPASVVFTFDPDAAGEKAALRVYGDASKFNALTFVASGPAGLDPSDLRQQQGDSAVVEMLKNRKPLFEFVIQHRLSQFNLSDIDSRVAAARAAAPVVAEIVDPALRSGYTRMLAEWVSLDVTDVSAMVGGNKNQATRARVEPLRTSDALPTTEPIADKLETQIMQVLVQNPTAFSVSQLRRMQAAGISTPDYKALLEIVLENAERISEPSFANLLVTAADEPLQAVVRQLALAPLPLKSEADLGKYSLGIVNAAMIKALDREKTDLLAALRRAELAASEEQKVAIQRQLVELEAERRSLMN